MNDKSRLPGFYKKSVSERVEILHEREYITDEDRQSLLGGNSVIEWSKMSLGCLACRWDSA